MRYWNDCRAFFRQFRQQYHTTGSILPSSRALARALCRPMRRATRPCAILEVGPGTGAVTVEIVSKLRPDNRLDIVEINADFVAHLESRFEEEEEFRRRRAQCRIIHSPLQEVPGEGVYDFMISGLPLNNFSLALVEDIFRSYRRLLKPEGVLSYFEYVAIRDMKMSLMPSESERLRTLGEYLEKQLKAHQIAEEIVWFNVPPALARHLRFGR
ncbi:MAG: methyltransferase domain-containing protein [Gemmataceae bacterium]|nr:methyltransferase domain-containing protein [Gemmataceae bacterium]MCI0738036.1 methyltransferase domain-containing protein [Gemmataceae bacterium]